MSNQVFRTPEDSKLTLRQAIESTVGEELKNKKNKTVTYWSVVHKRKNGEEVLLADFEPNVVPDDFIDVAHNRLFTSASISGSGFNYIALSADDSQSEDPGETALTGEISSNGLSRVQAETRTHTNGTNESTIEHTFTLTGQQSDIKKGGLFNAASGPTLGPWSAFTTGGPTGQMEVDETIKITIIVATSTT